jgi:Transposase and inactivated derivatives
MHDVFDTVCNDFEAEMIEFDGEKDHVHLMINYPPKVQISKLVNSLKRGFVETFKEGISSFGQIIL